MDPSNDDCYFYYYSTCTKGDDCPFRHCKLALGTETVCSLWKEGLCVRQNCKFRHMESRINRKTIPCYWENQPGGCRKPHCVFLHQKVRSTAITVNSESAKLILPNSSLPAHQTPPLNSSLDASKIPTGKDSNDSLVLSPASVPVEPVVVSLNDGEESDTESVHTPSKIRRGTAGSMPDKLTSKTADGDDFGIKTLEQLRMEKIHRESEHFYKSVYDAPSLENIPSQFQGPSSMFERETYNADGGISHDDIINSSDLRSVLKRKAISKPLFESNNATTDVSRKRMIMLKRSQGNTDEDSLSISVSKKTKLAPDSAGSMDFQIKTLDEIKKEKSKTEGSKGLSVTVTVKQSRHNGDDTESEVQAKSRIKRPAQEIYRVKPSSRNGSSKDDSPPDPERKRPRLNVKSTVSVLEDKLSKKPERRILNLKKNNVHNLRSAISFSNLSGFLSFVRTSNRSNANNCKKELESHSNNECHSTNASDHVESTSSSLPDSTVDEEEHKEEISKSEVEAEEVLNSGDSLPAPTEHGYAEDFDELLMDDGDITLDVDEELESDNEKTGDIYTELEEMLKS